MPGELWDISASPKSQKLSRNGLKRLNLGNESMYLHLLELPDTISYGLGPADTKNDAKRTSRSTHIESQKNKKNEVGHETALDGSI